MNSNIGQSVHISQRFDQELAQVRELIAQMGTLVSQQVNNGLASFLHFDIELAQAVVEKDADVNALELKVDALCTKILATRQPAAGDLRFIVMALKVITDFERIGDEAQKLGRNTLKLANSTNATRPFSELKHLGEQVQSNLVKATKAFNQLDTLAAIYIIEQDEVINEEYDNVSRLLLTKMMEDPREIKNALRITWCARALERIGDHAKNICEYVFYLVEGKDLRHSSMKEIKQALAK